MIRKKAQKSYCGYVFFLIVGSFFLIVGSFSSYCGFVLSYCEFTFSYPQKLKPVISLTQKMLHNFKL